MNVEVVLGVANVKCAEELMTRMKIIQNDKDNQHIKTEKKSSVTKHLLNQL